MLTARWPAWRVAVKLRARVLFGHVYTALHRTLARVLAFLPPESRLGRWKRRMGQRLRPQPKPKLGFLYTEFARTYPAARFVQIGANDGVMSDPLHAFVVKTAWRGILVEPVPYLFERLRRNYPARPGLVFENVAIAAEPGQRPFYYLRETVGDSALPDWHAGLGSFLREVVVKHAGDIPDLEDRLVVQDVPCLTFAGLCQRHGFDQVDLLHMDTEGYDYEIIKTIDFTRYRPRLLVYEHHHLSPADRVECLQRLQAAGYECIGEGLDAICLNLRDLTPRDAGIKAAWQVLKNTPRMPL
jgi:FkbM family methyltransferase